MLTRIGAIVIIYGCTVFAWMILGTTVDQRTGAQDESLKTAVTQLWGTSQRQRAPEVYYQTQKQNKVVTNEAGKIVTKTETETTTHPLLLDGSDINVSLNLEHRQKGLLWYSIILNKHHRREVGDIFLKQKPRVGAYWKCLSSRFPTGEGRISSS